MECDRVKKCLDARRPGLFSRQGMLILLCENALTLCILLMCSGLLNATMIFEWLGTLNTRAVFVLGFASACFVIVGGFLAGSAIRSRILRTAVEKHLRERQCMTCQYSLIGLSPSTNGIRCPECGDYTDARLLGMAPAVHPLPPRASSPV